MSSLIEIYDHSQREAQNHLWPFMASLMIIFDPKKKVIDDKKNFCVIYDHSQREAQIYFIYDHLWLHWRSFLTKKSAKRKKPKTIDIIFDKESPIQVKNSWVILNPGQKKVSFTVTFFSSNAAVAVIILNVDPGS